MRVDGGKYYLKPVPSVIEAVFTDTVSDDDTDIRQQFSYKTVNGDPAIWKYIGLDNTSSMRQAYQSNASWPFMRSAEVFLIKAIADLRLNNYSSAFNFVNMIREARGLEPLDDETFDYRNTEKMDSVIFNERARELAFEGKRWYDLMLRSKLNGRNMLAKAVAAKYPAEQQEEIQARLEDEENWYIPVDPKLWE